LKDLTTIPGLLIIAGNARNVGKTTLATGLIAALASEYYITGLKVSSIRPGDQSFHGTHTESAPDTFIIQEETGSDESKDTYRMLMAGARNAFYIRSRDEFIPQAMDAFMKMIPPRSLLICESRSLGEFVKPDLLVVIHKHGHVPGIKDIAGLEARADVILHSQEQEYYPDAIFQAFRVENGRWAYNPLG
jgi:hypothetical protein